MRSFTPASLRNPSWAVDTVLRLRLVLPVAIFLIVLLHQTWETVALESWSPLGRLFLDMSFYGLVGPLVTFWTLDWIARAMVTREEIIAARQQAEEAVRQLNRELEARVAERTAQLEALTRELKGKNDALVGANAELKQLDGLKDEFVALVSHELRAPLTNINASVELLLARESGNGQRAKLEIIGQEASRLTRLVQGVLDINRMSAGKIQFMLAPLDPAELCRAALKRQQGSRHTWHLDVTPGLPSVLADADRAGQVLNNLLDNAAKYSPEGSRVDLSVRATPDGRAVLFTVTDQGVGIPAAELGRIFERFHRVERGDARETYGHGLGLYIARRLIEAQGGQIWVESTPGHGATFLFTLPTAPDEP